MYKDVYAEYNFIKLIKHCLLKISRENLQHESHLFKAL